MLALHDKPKAGTGFVMDLTPWTPGRTFTKRAVGGFYAGSAPIVGMSRLDMIDLYTMYLGNRVRENVCGLIAWEGMIYEMRLVLDGQEYVRTLAPERFHNRVNVKYSSTVGATTAVGWSENTDSSGMYGRVDYIDSQAGMTTAAATALQARRLKEYGWPRSWMGQYTGGKDSLTLGFAGMYTTLFWRYREASGTNTPTAIITALLASTYSEFVTARRIGTNSLSVSYDALPTARRVGDIFEELIAQGDASGNVWKGGVYAGDCFDYEQAPTTHEYQVLSGKVCDLSGAPAEAALLSPGFLLLNASAPIVQLPAGTSYSAWDDPRIGYVDEVQFDADSNLTWRIMQGEESMELLQRRIQRGSI